jgi:hypothetical protein
LSAIRKIVVSAAILLLSAFAVSLGAGAASADTGWNAALECDTGWN